jgi:hypothetical protein
MPTISIQIAGMNFSTVGMLMVVLMIALGGLFLFSILHNAAEFQNERLLTLASDLVSYETGE